MDGWRMEAISGQLVRRDHKEPKFHFDSHSLSLSPTLSTSSSTSYTCSSSSSSSPPLQMPFLLNKVKWKEKRMKKAKAI